MFHCLPNESKCEWRNLSGFVVNYNRIFSTDYTLVECLDVYPSARKNPEFRLKSPKNKDIVLEHKIIPWPPDHLKNHRIQHDFMELVGKSLNAEFPDGLYILTANSADLVPVKRKIQKWVNDITRTILTNRKSVQDTGYIRGTEPIPWYFRRISDIERDDDMPDKGVGVQLDMPDNSFDFSEEDEKEMNEGVKKRLVEHLDKTAEKFKGYDECLKIFVTEIYSDNYLLSHELIEQIATEIAVPDTIDEIWVGHPVWINEKESTTAYKQIKFNKT